jgi:hypothetical protein
MDTTLVTVSVLSMGMASALSVIVWRLLRDERRRSEARVEALRTASRMESRGGDVDAAGQWVLDHADAPELVLHSEPGAAGPMFVEPPRSSSWRNRLAIMAGIALIGTTVLLFALSANTTPGGRTSASPAQATVAAAEPATAGLELLSLKDSRTADALTITGMVHNPRTGALLSHAAVTAYAFDDKGAFVASGRALLDVTALAPGDDSPFVVTVRATDTVTRYRIGFRSEDGRVIAHVDKRQQGPIAALRGGAGPDSW